MTFLSDELWLEAVCNRTSLQSVLSLAIQERHLDLHGGLFFCKDRWLSKSKTNQLCHSLLVFLLLFVFLNQLLLISLKNVKKLQKSERLRSLNKWRLWYEGIWEEKSQHPHLSWEGAFISATNYILSLNLKNSWKRQWICLGKGIKGNNVMVLSRLRNYVQLSWHWRLSYVWHMLYRTPSWYFSSVWLNFCDLE